MIVGMAGRHRLATPTPERQTLKMHSPNGASAGSYGNLMTEPTEIQPIDENKLIASLPLISMPQNFMNTP